MAATLTSLTLNARDSFRVAVGKAAPGSAASTTLTGLAITHEYEDTFALTYGTGSGQANYCVVQDRTLAANSDETLDLAAGLTDVFGVTSSGMATVKYIRIEIIPNPDGTTDGSGLVIGAASADQFIGWLGSATDTVSLEAGGVPYVAGSAAGKSTTGATDLKVDNADATNKTSYRITLIGISA